MDDVPLSSAKPERQLSDPQVAFARALAEVRRVRERREQQTLLAARTSWWPSGRDRT